MFQPLIILLLVNSYGRGLGNPIQSAPNGIIAHSLEELAKSCANEFLVIEINNHMKECNVAFVKPYTDVQFQCGIFYDITSRLCAATASPLLEVKQEDFTARLAEDLSIADLCNETKHWNVADLPNYPLYKQTVSRVLSNGVTCGRLCGGPDVFDVNYYCKLYKIGIDVLKAPTVPISQLSNEGKVDATLTGADNTKIEQPLAVDSIKVNETQLHGEQKLPMDLSTTLKKPLANVDDLSAKNSETNLANGEVGTALSQPDAQLLLSNKKDHADAENNVLQTSEKDKQENITNEQIPKIQVNNGDVVPSSKSDDKVKDDVPKQNPEVEQGQDDKPNDVDALDFPNLPDDQGQDDYQDSRDDTPVGDNKMDLPIMKDLNEPPQQPPTKAPTKKIADPVLPSFNGDSQRDIYPNMQDSLLDQQDNNFFPFFLTAVILVVLIYVLYHNKSKVSKVVIGLIVEGRQPGRRRNSRGHAYRRLDTLEQAMSSNTAAAPSKIIY